MARSATGDEIVAIDLTLDSHPETSESGLDITTSIVSTLPNRLKSDPTSRPIQHDTPSERSYSLSPSTTSSIMDRHEDRDLAAQRYYGVPSIAVPLSPSMPTESVEAIRQNGPTHPGLLEPIQLVDSSSYGTTPEVSNGFDRQLNLTSSDDASDDSLDAESESSVEDETTEAPPYGLPRSELSTGLCYDERMRFHSEVAAPTGESVHPEDPRRIYYIFKELCEAGLAIDESKKSKRHVDKVLKRIAAREVTKLEACLVHTEQHWDFVESTEAMSNERLIDLSEARDMDSIYFNQFSFVSSKLSAGGAIETCRAVVNRNVKNAIAVIRPPGHHAEVNCTMGFCLFNNVCIASRVCQEEFGKDCRKILILDWDVHHGNGCQKAFYTNPNILYISIHVHMDGHFYPSGDEGDMWHVGAEAGVGYNINIPWPTKGMGDGDYMFAFQQIVMPIATEFDPDLVIVAAGFDAAAGDELGGCFVSPACYAHMTHMLMSLADGKVAVCLEGGYNLQSISKSALAVTKTLMGEPPDRLIQTSATTGAVETVQQVKNIQSRYWRSIYPKQPVDGEFGGERLHDIIRDWQARHLYDEFKLTQLYIFRENISKSFDRQVLSSQDYEHKRRLFVIFHDPPEIMKDPKVFSNGVKLHETWLVDETKSYISTAITHNFGVIDVGIPSHITDNETGNVVKYNHVDDDLGRKNGERLAIYLWENYIEPYEFPEGIILCGVGDSFHAVAKMLGDIDAERFVPDLDGVGGVRGVLGFIANQPVRPVNVYSAQDAALVWGHGSGAATWYRENSRVYVSPTHSFWERVRDNPRKMSRKYGTVVETKEKVLGRMMGVEREEAWRWLLGQMGGASADDEVGVVEVPAGGDVEMD